MAVAILSLAVQPPSPPPATTATDVGPIIRGLLGGAAYGIVAAGISHPFDTVKTRQQFGRSALVGGSSLLSRLSGLYKGVGAATAASIFFRTVPFIGYEATRNALSRRQLLVDAPLIAAFLGGVVGGAVRCLH